MPSRAISTHVTSRNDFAGPRVRIVRTGRGARGFLAVREPVTLVGAFVGIEDGDAAVAAVGDEHLVRRRVVRDRGRTIQRGLAVGAVHLAGRADRQQVPAVARELQDVRVGRGRWRRRRLPAAAPPRPAVTASGSGGAPARALRRSWRRAAAAARGRWRRISARRRDPDIAFAVDGDAAGHLRPRVSRARTAPAAHELAGGVVLQHQRRRHAAHARRREAGTPPRPAAGIMPFSLPSSESLPRCTTHTWFCASTVTPDTDPITHESSGNGAGHKGATR